MCKSSPTVTCARTWQASNRMPTDSTNLACCMNCIGPLLQLLDSGVFPQLLVEGPAQRFNLAGFQFFLQRVLNLVVASLAGVLVSVHANDAPGIFGANQIADLPRIQAEGDLGDFRRHLGPGYELVVAHHDAP